MEFLTDFFLVLVSWKEFIEVSSDDASSRFRYVEGVSMSVDQAEKILNLKLAETTAEEIEAVNDLHFVFFWIGYFELMDKLTESREINSSESSQQWRLLVSCRQN